VTRYHLTVSNRTDKFLDKLDKKLLSRVIQIHCNSPNENSVRRIILNGQKQEHK